MISGKKYIQRISYFKKCKIVVYQVLILLLFASCYVEKSSSGKAEIMWDKYGVPHVFANDMHEMYYAEGWAQMHNHANLILKLYGQSRGRAAEYWGSKYLDIDKKLHLFNVPEQAAKVYKQQTSKYKRFIDAFVKGINDYAEKHPDLIDEKFKVVLPVTPVDVVSHIIRVTSIEFVASKDINMNGILSNAGSNAIALAPSKTLSGNSMLVINPHLPWSDYFTMFEIHLKIEAFNIYGAALVGIPTIIMGFNDYLGWAHTINPIDASDSYKLILKEDGYLLNQKIHHFKTKTKTLKVKQEDGTITNKVIEFKYSKHGPVISQNEQDAIAVRIAGFENVKLLEQYHKMSQAKNIDEFEEALKMMQIPMFNIIYADKTGNIFYLFNGNIPVRPEGNFAFWDGMINGTDSKFIWKKIHTYEDLPKCLNPISGFIQNCNDPPWTCTFPTVLNPKKFPAYMSSTGTTLRAQRAINLIINSSIISFGQLADIKHNTGLEAADRFLDDLINATKNYPDSTVLEAARVLKAWDKKTEPKSRGAILFTHWWDKIGSDLFKIPWNYKLPITTPGGLKDPEKAVELLEKAANEISQKYGSMEVAWSDIHRFRSNNSDYPANGGPGNYGILRTIYFDNGNKNIKSAIGGETFIAIVEFGEKTNAKVILSYGNSTQPNRKSENQFEMLSKKELRPALLEKKDIIKEIGSQETLQISF